MKTTAVKREKIAGRQFIYPKKPSGKLYEQRKWVSYGLLLLLFSSPFLKLNGEQLVLLNFLERKFVFFGLIFTPQDFYLFALAMLVFILFIISFTVVLGRLWCGWACPQTIFMEMIFRRIEYWIEGDASQQLKLDQQGWTTEKIVKKTVKHVLFVLISFFIANIFLAYMIGSDELMNIMKGSIGSHLVGFISIWAFTLLFYFVFAYIREVVCTVICPYGRLQGVLLDQKSLVVAYDHRRGEPRGHLRRGENHSPKGDCIDCNLCVQVCPTGIDIRQGTQLECVNCTACIDSCNAVMEKINKPLNLIGFYNNEYVEKGKPFKIGLKAYGYAAILLAIMLLFSGLIYRREDVQTTVLRASGTLYQAREDGRISNLYNAELINKTNKPYKFTLRSNDPGDEIQFIQVPGELPAEKTIQLTFFLIKKREKLKAHKTKVVFEIQADQQVISTAKSTFFSPIP